MAKSAPLKKSGHKSSERLKARVQAINDLNDLLCREKKNNWAAADVCGVLTGGGGYQSCWLATTDENGSIGKMAWASSVHDDRAAEQKGGIRRFQTFIRRVIKSHEIVVNRAPLCRTEKTMGDSLPATLSLRIEYSGSVYGVLSVCLEPGEEEHPEQHLLVRKAAADIAFELYSMEMQRKQQELIERLFQAEKIYRAVFETTGTGTIIVDDNTTIIAANQEFAKLSGYGRKEIEGKMSWQDFITREDIEMMRVFHRQRRTDPGSAPRNYEFHFMNRHGKVKDIYGTFDMVPGTQMNVASFMDITAQKKLESEIIRVSELERQRIGNDLHDGLGPHLVGVKFMLSILEKRLVKHQLREEIKAIREINAHLTQGINHTRRIVKGLCPVDIDAEGLIVALEDLTMNIETVYGIKCTFEHDESLLITDNIMATHLFLIAQESVNNAIKHSKATAIEVIIAADDDTVVLRISDNGTGIEKLLDRKKGVGINIMKYRARVINASLDIRKNSLGGISVSCIMKKSLINAPDVTVEGAKNAEKQAGKRRKNKDRSG
jgi:PAS domain S-box-containing protein